jgi:ketosteroid isomerase-like protein
MDDESEVLDRAAAWQRSIEERDADAAGRYLDDDYALELVQPEAAVFRREAWLAMLPDYVVSAYEVLDRIVDIDGDVAVVLQRVRMTATVRGADRSGPFVLTDVWRRRAGEWRVWRRTSTPLAAGSMPEG